MSDSESSENVTPPPPIKKRRTKTVNQKYKTEYTVKYPVVIRSKLDDEHAFCTVCNCDISVAHGGIDDVRKHTETGTILSDHLLIIIILRNRS